MDLLTWFRSALRPSTRAWEMHCQCCKAISQGFPWSWLDLALLVTTKNSKDGRTWEEFQPVLAAPSLSSLQKLSVEFQSFSTVSREFIWSFSEENSYLYQIFFKIFISHNFQSSCLPLKLSKIQKLTCHIIWLSHVAEVLTSLCLISGQGTWYHFLYQ